MYNINFKMSTTQTNMNQQNTQKFNMNTILKQLDYSERDYDMSKRLCDVPPLYTDIHNNMDNLNTSLKKWEQSSIQTSNEIYHKENPNGIYLPDDCWNLVKEFLGLNKYYVTKYFKNIPKTINFVRRRYTRDGGITQLHYDVDYKLNIIKRTPKLLQVEFDVARNTQFSKRKLKIRKDEKTEYIEINKNFIITPDYIVQGIHYNIIQDGVERQIIGRKKYKV